jgi:hypothetical protein
MNANRAPKEITYRTTIIILLAKKFEISKKYDASSE